MHRSLIVALASLSILSLSAEAGARTKVKDIDTSTIIVNSVGISSLCGNAGLAGSDSTFVARLSRVGKVLVRVSASWDWNSYNGVDHPAAHVNITAQAVKDPTKGIPTVTCPVFNTDATVRITKQAFAGGSLLPAKGDIVAEITGGSVYELVIAPDPRVTAAAQVGGICPAIGFPGFDGTINESIINFEADPGQPDTPRGSISGSVYTPRIARITGSIRTTFNSCTGESTSYVVHEVERP
jgi:hypothetical protein